MIPGRLKRTYEASSWGTPASSVLNNKFSHCRLHCYHGNRYPQTEADRHYNGDLENLDPSTTTGQVLDLKWSIFQSRVSVITVVLRFDSSGRTRHVSASALVRVILNYKSDPCRRSPGVGKKNISSDAEAEQYRERVSSASRWITLETRF